MEKYYYLAAAFAAFGIGAPFLVLFIGDMRNKWRDRRQ